VRTVCTCALLIATALILGAAPSAIAQDKFKQAQDNTYFVTCFTDSSGTFSSGNSVRSEVFHSPDDSALAYTETVATYSQEMCSNTSSLYIRTENKTDYRLAFQRTGTSAEMGRGIRIVAWSKNSGFLLFEVSKWQYGSDAPAENELWVYNTHSGACAELQVSAFYEVFGEGCLVNIEPVGFVSEDVVSLQVSAKQYYEPEGDMRKPECLERQGTWYYDLSSNEVTPPEPLPKAGIISGTVVDEGGAPLEDATVNWFDLEPKYTVEVQAGQRPFVKSDGKGHFYITHLIAGDRYALVAHKEEAGYPDLAQPLYNPLGKTPVAVAQAQDRVPDVVIQVGPKAARFQWIVKDAVSGALLPGIGFAIYRSDGRGENKGMPPVGGSAPGTFSYLIPTDIGVTIEFSAEGYKTWYYPGAMDKAGRTFLRAVPGENIKLEVALQPAAAGSR
jgi:hypothetical protein